jgi:hypothetical protein
MVHTILTNLIVKLKEINNFFLIQHLFYNKEKLNFFLLLLTKVFYIFQSQTFITKLLQHINFS